MEKRILLSTPPAVPEAASMTTGLPSDWPSNSPDLSPPENLCAAVRRKMRDARANNADDLMAANKANWASVTHSQADKALMHKSCKKRL